MKRHKTKALFSFFFFHFSFFIFLLVLATCSTIPKAAVQNDNGDFGLIPAGGALYLWANVNETRPLLESISFGGMSLKQAGDILNRTNSAAAVFSGSSGAAGSTPAAGSTETAASSGVNNSFFINLRGKYPTFGAGLSFTFSKDWKKLKSNTGNSYWSSLSSGIGVALNSQLTLVSGGDPFAKTASAQNAVRVPGGFDQFRTGSVMAGWFPQNDPVNEFLSKIGLPLQIPAEDFFFSVIKQKGSDNADLWELNFHIRTSSVNQARALVTLFSLVRAFIAAASPDPAGSAPVEEKTSFTDYLPALFANAPQQQDAVLTLKSQPFTTSDLALLFNGISVYSNNANL